MDKIMDNMQNGGMTSNFPGLSKEQIERLEQVTANLTGTAKIQAQQKLYQSALQQLKQNEVKDNRVKTENELYYKSMDEKDPKQQNYLQSNVRLEQLADLTKNKFGLKQDANTKDVLSGLMQYAQDQGVSLDSLNNYLDSGDESFLYDMGLKEQTPEEEPGFWSKVGQVGTDIVGGALASASSLPKMAVKGVAEGVGWAAKKLGADEEKVDYYVNDLENYLDDSANSKDIGADSDSVAFNVTKGVGDLAQTMAGEQLIKGAVQGTTQGANLLNKIKNAPTRGKMIAGGVEGAGDMALYSIIADNKLPSREEEGIGAGLGALIPGAGAAFNKIKDALKKGSAKLELNGLLNPAKLETVRAQMVSEGAKLPGKGTAEDVGKWMVERGFKGTKDEIVSQLKAHSDKAKGLVDDLLATSTTQHQVPEVNEALKMLYEDYSKTPGLKDKANEIASMMKDTYTASEMNKVKRYMDDAYNMFKMNGGETAGLKSEGLREIRKTIKNKIEDVAEQEGLGNIKLLNNETQVARGLLDGITKKEAAASVRELLSPFQSGTMGSIIGGIGGAGYGDTWDQKLKGIVLGAIGGKLLGSTSIKTKLANMIGKFGGVEKKELTEYIASNGQKALSEKGEQALLKMAGENKEIATEIKQEVEKEAKKQIEKEANKVDDVVNDSMATKIENAGNTKYQHPGIANANDINISSQEGLNIKNFKNGRTVQEIADSYGIKTNVVDKILTPEGEKALGSYGDGIINLSKTLKESTAPHELLHATFDIVDKGRKQSILEGIKKQLGYNDLDAEEWLADSFSEYFRTGKFALKNAPSGFIEKVKQFFYEIKSFIDGTYKNKTEVKKLFDDIISENGLGGIKSATDNIGTYSKESNDIRYQLDSKKDGSNTKKGYDLNTKNLDSNNRMMKSLDERVSGDDLLNAQDLIEEIESVGAKVDDKGYVTVYHQTTADNAKKIIESGKMMGKEKGIFFSTSSNAMQADGRGTVKMEFKIPAEKLELDDLFSDNADLKILSKPGEYIDISEYIVK